MNKQLPLNPRILYVEDDDDTKELVRFLLTQENYEVVLAESSEQALLIARDLSFNLYLIDNWLAGLSGVELCRRFREFDSTTPVLFYSAAAYAQDIREAIAAGAQGYITKPAENQKLLEEISRLVCAPKKDARPTSRHPIEQRTSTRFSSSETGVSGWDFTSSRGISVRYRQPGERS